MSAQFDDGKEDGALRTIGEVSRALGIKTHVLRYWEQQFPSLDPLKRSGGRRYYRPEDVALIETIDRLVHREGYTIKGAQQVLASGKVEAAAAPMPQAEAVPVAPPEPVSLLMTDDTSDLGGVGSFFGTTAAPEPAPEPEAAAAVEAAPEVAAPVASGMPREDVLARLRAIRSVLAEALAA